MIVKKWFSLFPFSLFMLSGFFLAQAQNNPTNFIVPKTNSKANVIQTIAATQIEISYNRPNKRGRKIFGNLVPFGKVWRTGSDAATTIYFSTAIELEGIDIDLGSYELFTIPNEDEWEIILQKNRKQWGSYKYHPENDIARFTVATSATCTAIETFTISIDQIGSNHGTLNISWDQVIVPIAIHIDLKETVIPKLEKALLQEGRRPYFHAAMFYYENEIDIPRAAELMVLALENNPEHIGMLYRQALILNRNGNIEEAIEAAKKSLAGAQKMDAELRAEYTGLNTVLLKKLQAMKQ